MGAPKICHPNIGPGPDPAGGIHHRRCVTPRLRSARAGARAAGKTGRRSQWPTWSARKQARSASSMQASVGGGPQAPNWEAGAEVPPNASESPQSSSPNSFVSGTDESAGECTSGLATFESETSSENISVPAPGRRGPSPKPRIPGGRGEGAQGECEGPDRAAHHRPSRDRAGRHVLSFDASSPPPEGGGGNGKIGTSPNRGTPWRHAYGPASVPAAAAAVGGVEGGGRASFFRGARRLHRLTMWRCARRVRRGSCARRGRCYDWRACRSRYPTRPRPSHPGLQRPRHPPRGSA